ncbi:endonuclease G, mitochondrial-like [Artemia franciscana]|uniref:Endonuclease n=1 Tax=Artemia franciscana TaxID=6661 RepID=A0AA88KV46_ARTSF|nr:hypothetical protein QYM36_018103 [Artemia franciscana]KAK2703436.1 hypothetical protein QYM36_018103 [Artemia franciscana]
MLKAVSAAIGIGASFVAGIIYEKDCSIDRIPIKPGIPLFGTVSAAEPISNLPVPLEPDKNAPRISQVMRFGFPSLSNIKSYGDYVLSYDTRNRSAHWVFEHLTFESVAYTAEVDRSKSDFYDDQTVHPFFRALNSDYKGSGFDRGHLAAAGNHKKCQQDMNETFVLSNIAPQVGKGFNRDKWNDLERYIRNQIKNYKNIYVCTGPLFLPQKEGDGKLYVKYQVIGTNHVAVPTHFYKVCVYENVKNELELEAFVMPNQPISDKIPVENFRVPPETVERASGLLFFDRLSRSKLKKINGKKI